MATPNYGFDKRQKELAKKKKKEEKLRSKAERKSAESTNEAVDVDVQDNASGESTDEAESPS